MAFAIVYSFYEWKDLNITGRVHDKNLLPSALSRTVANHAKR